MQTIYQKQTVLTQISLQETCCRCLNPLPNDKILDWFKLEVFADDKMKLAKIMIFVFIRIENIVGKEENAVLLFPQCFQEVSLSGSFKVRIVW